MMQTPGGIRGAGQAPQLESTAMLLESQLALDPRDPLVSALAEFLVRKRSGRWWNTDPGNGCGSGGPGGVCGRHRRA
ncbi:MAG: hypothetical protein MZV70_74325 [Desulfobacterales bacterium]|nr:hypothetical protein [Desulfobacterales bacterium]